ncbi:hypothetical protein SAMN02745729_1357 [Marinobacterium iners DSM 11526]|uniref:Uncharacterized protein n=2 Tax=Marinobacterium iners TaxID=48076 RepID=A0A1H4HBX4_9GAMM|nr:hypothetical protein SAMN02745729_1357 [Marinobacterium iners DSM 11526]
METTLYGVLQFIFSIAFGWLLSKRSSEASFREEQRRFATSAYRRIKEIEASCTRLKDDLYRGVKNAKSSGASRDLEISLVRAEEVLETTESSKLDWADIIGDEISKIEEVEKLRKERLKLTGRKSDSFKNNDVESDQQKLASLEEKLESIKSSLPDQLKLLLEQEDSEETPVSEAISELEKYGFIELDGFGDTDMPLDRDPGDLKPQEKLKIKLMDLGDRTATLIASDLEGRTVGSFTNKYSGNYSEFTMAVCSAMESSTFDGVVMDVDEELINGMRRYFIVHAYPNEKAKDA